jgi:hypothetical protein
MNRDLVIHHLVGVEAQLRRIERLSSSIGDPTEHKARIPALITETRRTLQTLTGRIEQVEGAAR